MPGGSWLSPDVRDRRGVVRLTSRCDLQCHSACAGAAVCTPPESSRRTDCLSLIICSISTRLYHAGRMSCSSISRCGGLGVRSVPWNTAHRWLIFPGALSSCPVLVRLPAQQARLLTQLASGRLPPTSTSSASSAFTTGHSQLLGRRSWSPVPFVQVLPVSFSRHDQRDVGTVFHAVDAVRSVRSPHGVLPVRHPPVDVHLLAGQRLLGSYSTSRIHALDVGGSAQEVRG